MPQVHAEVTIDRPIEEVFAYISDPHNDSYWLSASNGVSNVPEGPIHVGMTYDGVAHFLGRRMDFKVEVTEYDPPTEFGYRSTHGRLESHRTIHLQAVDGGATQVMMDLEAEGYHRILVMAEDLMIRAGRRHEQNSLEELRDILETHGPDHPRHD